jgi:hypothetical protein
MCCFGGTLYAQISHRDGKRFCCSIYVPYMTCRLIAYRIREVFFTVPISVSVYIIHSQTIERVSVEIVIMLPTAIVDLTSFWILSVHRNLTLPEDTV